MSNNNQDIIIRRQKEECDAKLQNQSEYFEMKFNEQNETYEQTLEELQSNQNQDVAFEELQGDYFEDFKELNETYKQNVEELKSLQGRYNIALKEIVHTLVSTLGRTSIDGLIAHFIGPGIGCTHLT